MSDSLSAGAKLDIAKLLNSFASTQSFKYKDFIPVWQSMKFSLIFCGRKTIYELIEFTEDLMQITKTFLLQPHPVNIRAGALFTLYGLYHRQPSKTTDKDVGYVRIRMTVEDLEILEPFILSMKTEGRFDIVYIFYSLAYDGAFNFTCVERQYIVERKRQKDLVAMEEAFISVSRALDPAQWIENFLCEKKFVNEWRTHETEYNKLKEELTRDDPDCAASLQMTGPDFITELINSSIKWNFGRGDPVTDQGERRRALKMKALPNYHPNSNQRSRRPNNSSRRNTDPALRKCHLDYNLGDEERAGPSGMQNVEDDDDEEEKEEEEKEEKKFKVREEKEMDADRTNSKAKTPEFRTDFDGIFHMPILSEDDEYLRDDDDDE